jgi:hypothetical protein
MEKNEKKVNNLIFWDLDGTLMYCGYDGTKALNDTFQKLFGLEDACSVASLGHSMDSVTLNRIFNIYLLDNILRYRAVCFTVICVIYLYFI